MRIRRAALAVVASSMLLAGCTSGAGDISPAAQRALRQQVQAVRVAAASGPYVRLRQEVKQLKRLVVNERDAGRISSARAADLLNAADALLIDAQPRRTTSPTPTPTSESPSPSPTSESPSPSESPTPSVTPTQSAAPEPSSTSPQPVVSVSAGAVTDDDGG